jgi:hypothetical protein
VSRLLPPPGLAPAQKAGPGVGHLPPAWRFSYRQRRVSPSEAAWRLRGDLASGSGQRLWMSIAGSSSGDAWKTSRSSWTWMSSPQSVGGPRAGETGGGSSGSPRYVRICRMGLGSRTGSPQQPEVAKSAKARDGFALGKQSERDQPDVTAAVWALERKLLPHPGQEFRPRNPGGVVGGRFVA